MDYCRSVLAVAGANFRRLKRDARVWFIFVFTALLIHYYLRPVINYGMAIADGCRKLVTDFGITKEYLAIVRNVICYAVNVIFWVYYAKKKNIVQAVAIVYFTMMCGTRGFTHEFHSMPYVAVTMFMAAYLIGLFTEYFKTCNAREEQISKVQKKKQGIC